MHERERAAFVASFNSSQVAFVLVELRMLQKSILLIAASLVSICASCSDASVAAPAPSPVDALTGATQNSWQIASRSENGGSATLPDCAKDDVLIFRKGGKFQSLIGATQCNPQETDVIEGMFSLQADQKTIKFATGQFDYTGKLVEYTANTIIIEFDLGPGFLIKDTFVLKK
jgi:hypothetical protein